MRTALIGAVPGTVVALKVMARLGHLPQGLVTLPLEKSNRHSDFVDLRPLAAELGVPVIEAAQVNTPDCIQSLASMGLDYLFVIGWSQILSSPLLSIARSGTIGSHPSALPECRGRAVIPWTILMGKSTTGTSLLWLDEGVDSGDLVGTEMISVAPDETAGTLLEKHMVALDQLMERTLLQLAAGQRPATPQDHARATYCAKRTADDGHLDWNQPAELVWRLIRAVGGPYPPAFTFRSDQKLLVHTADWISGSQYTGLAGQIQAHDQYGSLVLCGDGGVVRLKSVQFEGGPVENPVRLFKVHEKLGLDSLALWKRLNARENV